MYDFGYDVADYCDVDPVFGTLQTFDRLLAEAHARDMRVILDLVLNHSSHLHPWFLESRRSRHNPKRDWYIWADPKADGGPPNNTREHHQMGCRLTITGLPLPSLNEPADR